MHPQYFALNNIPIQLTGVRFETFEVCEDFCFGFMEGNFEYENLSQIIPSIEDVVFPMENGNSYSFKTILELSKQIGTLNTDGVEEIGIECLNALVLLGELCMTGSIFLVNKENGNQVMSIVAQPETFFLIHQEISLLDLSPSALDRFSNDRIEVARIAGESCLIVAQILHQGLYDFEEDIEKAIKYYQISYTLNNPVAAHTLGILNTTGGDYDEAHLFFLRGACYGHLDSQFNVAVNYFNGKGVEKNYVLAILWSDIVRRQGDKEINNLLQQLSPLKDQLNDDSMSVLEENLKKIKDAFDSNEDKQISAVLLKITALHLNNTLAQ